MEIDVIDTFAELSALMRRPLRERPAALRDLLAPMYAHVPMQGDIVELHHFGGGCRVDRDDDRYLRALDRLVTADVRGKIAHALDQAWQHLSASVPGIKGPESLRVLFMLGDPDDPHLASTGGYYGMGGMPGWLYLIGWPSDEVIGKLAYCAVHEFHHQVRYHNVAWNPVTVTVGEHVVAEGLAEAFVEELYGAEARGPWGRSLSADALAGALARITADLGVTGMQNTPAYVLGDDAAIRFGQEPKGLPPFAGYPVGLHLVEKHLRATGLTAAASTILPAAEILRTA